MYINLPILFIDIISILILSQSTTHRLRSMCVYLYICIGDYFVRVYHMRDLKIIRFAK